MEGPLSPLESILWNAVIMSKTSSVIEIALVCYGLYAAWKEIIWNIDWKIDMEKKQIVSSGSR